MDITNFINQKKLENKSPNTIVAYTSALEDFSKFLKGKILSQDIIRGYLVELQNRGLKPSSMSHRLVAIKEYLKFIKLPDVVPDIKIKVDKILPSVLTQEEVNKIVSSLRHTRDKLIVKLLYSTGMRISELVSLNEEVVNNVQFKITGKGSKERNIFMPKELLADLNKIKTGQGAMFKNRFGNRLSVATIEKTIRICGKLMLNKRVHPHMLRSSYATRLFNAGVDILNLSKVLGEDVATTKKYTSVIGEKLGGIVSEAWEKGKLTEPQEKETYPIIVNNIPPLKTTDTD